MRSFVRCWLAAVASATLAACGDAGGGGPGAGGSAAADAAPVTPDAAGSTPDAAPATPDAAGSTPDVAGSTLDAAPETPDAAGSAPDAAGFRPDAAGLRPDAASSTPDAGAPGPVLGPPIEALAGRWTWVDFPDSTCDDGTPTGIGVYPGDGPGVVVFLNGGGLCWDAQTCLVLHTSTSGPYGAAQFAQVAPAFAGTILDPAAPDNPFRGWSHVFVPYCTGDGHTGDRRVQYQAGGGGPRDFDHTGARNLDLFFSRIAATWAAPANFALVGPSAGGFGALLNYAHVRDYWRGGRGFLLSDGFPLLRGDALDDALQAAWNAAWGLDARLNDLCAGCAADPALLIPTLGARFPDDRFGLSGTTRDAVLPTFFGLTVEAYAAALLDVQTTIYDAVPNVRTFTVDGGQHTLILHPAGVQQGGVTLQTWLTRMLSGDPTWANVRP